MKYSIIGFAILLFLFACSKEECLSCIAESKSGKIIETRLSCDSDNNYLKGFESGFRDRYKDIDSVEVHCTTSY